MLLTEWISLPYLLRGVYMTSVCVDQPYLKSAFDLIGSVRCVDLSRHDGHKLCRGHHAVGYPGREKLIEQSCASGALNFLGPLRFPTREAGGFQSVFDQNKARQSRGRFAG